MGILNVKKARVKDIVAVIMGIVWIILLVSGLICKKITILDFIQCILLLVVSTGIMYLNGTITLLIITHLGNFKRECAIYDIFVAIFSVSAIFNLCDIFHSGFSSDIIVTQTTLLGGYMGIYLFLNISYQKLKSKWKEK